MTPYNPNETLTCGSLLPQDLLKQSPTTSVELGNDFFTEYEIQALLQIGLEMYLKGASFTFTFQGLKRRLGIHQQKLTKALRRLREKNLIEKISDGYVITKMGGEMLSEYLVSCPTPSVLSSSKCVCASLKLTDSGITLDEFIQSLTGKWFGNYRFVGKARTEHRAIVEFTNEDSSAHVCCCLNSSGHLRIAITPADQQRADNSQNELADIIQFIRRQFSIQEEPRSGVCPNRDLITKGNLSKFLKTTPLVTSKYS